MITLPAHAGTKEKSMIKLGDLVRDKVSGYQGIVVGISDFLYGCKRIGIQAQNLHDGKPVESIWIDLPQAELIEGQKVKTVESDRITGGPISSIPQRQKDCRR